MTDFDDFAGGKLPQDKLSKIARGEPLSATEEFVRGQRLSTAEKTIRDHLDSPSMKLARDYLDSPAARLAREHAESPAAQLASQFGALTEQEAAAAKMAAIQKALEPPPGYAEQLAVIRFLDVEHDALAKIGAIFLTGIDPKTIEAIRGVQSFTIDPGLASAVSRAQQQLKRLCGRLAASPRHWPNLTSSTVMHKRRCSRPWPVRSATSLAPANGRACSVPLRRPMSRACSANRSVRRSSTSGRRCWGR